MDLTEKLEALEQGSSSQKSPVRDWESVYSEKYEELIRQIASEKAEKASLIEKMEKLQEVFEILITYSQIPPY